MGTMDKKALQTIKVYARQRPLTQNEVDSKVTNIVQKTTARELVIKSGFNEKKYNFDHIFNDWSSQSDVYNVVVAPFINSVINGYNCTVFAYGQTGTGKTHTIFGANKFSLDTDYKKDSSIGFIARASDHLFTELSKLSPKTEYTVQVSFLEIYNEEVKDLLKENVQLRVYEDPLNKGSVWVKDLSKITVFKNRDVNEWLNIGINERQNASTNSNLLSSRSHTIFTFMVNVREVNAKGDEIIKTGRLHLIDLAGSENTSRSAALDVRAREAGSINRSLITVVKVIKSLAQKMQHIPYRDSKLTRILQDSLGGNTKTAMVVTFSPNAHAWDETVNNLDLAQVARTIANCPQVNINRKQANLMQEMKNEIAKLTEDLIAARRGEGFYVSAEHYEKLMQNAEANNEKILESVSQIQELEGHKYFQEMQYRNLIDSFENTKVYLENVGDELRQKDEAIQQENNRLSTLKENYSECKEAASRLLDVCENSTKHGDIYHQKFQNKCAANMSNADIARHLIATADIGFKEVANVSRKCANEKSESISRMREAVDFLKNGHINELQQFNLPDEVKDRVKKGEFQLKLGDLSVGPYGQFRQNDITNFIHLIYGRHKTCGSKLDKVKNLVDDMKTQLTTERNKLDQHTEESVKRIDEEIRRQAEQMPSFEESLLKFTENVCQKEAEIQQTVRKDEEILAIMKEEHLRAEQEEKELMEELAQSDNVAKLLVELKEQKTNLQTVETIRDNANAYISLYDNKVMEQKELIQKVEEQLAEVECETRSQATSSQEEIGEYIRNLRATIFENCAKETTKRKATFQEWNNKLDECLKRSLNNGLESSDVLEDNLCKMSEILTKENAEVQEVIIRSLESTMQLCKNINLVGHAGDTPVKRRYSFPKSLRVAVLSKSLKENFAEEYDSDSDKENEHKN